MLKVDIVWDGIIPHISVNITDIYSLHCCFHFLDVIVCFNVVFITVVFHYGKMLSLFALCTLDSVLI